MGDGGGLGCETQSREVGLSIEFLRNGRLCMKMRVGVSGRDGVMSLSCGSTISLESIPFGAGVNYLVRATIADSGSGKTVCEAFRPSND